jgi:predicted dienelactone hydrolase
MRGLLFVLASLLMIGAPAAGTIGFQQLTVPDGADKSLAVAVWYPGDSAAISQAFGSFRQTVSIDGHVSDRALPLILISHGSTGSSASHYDTALALAQEGFVVAAVTHVGDNFADQSYAGNRKDLTDRPRQVALVLDYMLSKWSDHDHLDPARVGMFGFSLGGLHNNRAVWRHTGPEPDVGTLFWPSVSTRMPLCETAPRRSARPDHD